MRLLLHWLLSALAVSIVSRIVPGFVVKGVFAALIAAVVVGLVNATLGFFLKVITFPLAVVTLGIFWLIVNALMLKFAAVLIGLVNATLGFFLKVITFPLAVEK